MQCLEQRCLVVEALAGVGDEHGRNTQCVIYHKDWRRGVPSAITARLKCVANTSVRETRGVRLLLNKQLARKFLYHATFSVVFYEGVVLLGCTFS